MVDGNSYLIHHQEADALAGCKLPEPRGGRVSEFGTRSKVHGDHKERYNTVSNAKIVRAALC
jgi:hypothetical protein